MIIAVTKKPDGGVFVEADAPLTDIENMFIKDFRHVLWDDVPTTLHDFVRTVQRNYKGQRTDAAIAHVTREYGEIPRV